MKTFFLRKALPALGLAFALSTLALAQGTPPPGGGPGPSDPAGVPVDGGATLLLAGGVAYGLKKLRARRQAA